MTATRIKALLAFLLVVIGATAAGWYWWQQAQTRLPDTIAYGNGRIEAEEIQVATKYSGRVATVLVDEGDWVTAGQVLARMDTAEIEAASEKAKAEVARAQEGKSVV